MADVSNRNRKPAGVSAGGQFAVEPRTEPDLELDGTAPVPLTTLVPSDAEDLVITEFEHGDPTLSTIRVQAGEGKFYVDADSQPLGFIDGISSQAHQLGLDPDFEDGIENYLQTRSAIVEHWLRREYGISALTGEDWQEATAHFAAVLPTTATSDDIIDALRSAGKPVDLYNESDPGSAGARNMWPALAEYLAADDRRAQTATTTITWARRYPDADVTETWTAQVPLSLLRKNSDQGAGSELDQYICDNGQPLERPEGDRSGREFDSLQHEFVDRRELRPAFLPVPELGKDTQE